MNLEKVRSLALKEPKPLLARVAKLMEESGELAQEILIHEKQSGAVHKEKGPDGILGECVDVTLVALSIFFKEGGTVKQLSEIIDKKTAKWEKFQTRSL